MEWSNKPSHAIVPLTRVADPDPALLFDADPDPTFHFNADPDPAPQQVMRICDYWSTDPPGLHLEPPRLNCERLRHKFKPLELLNIHSDADADPDPPFHSKNNIGFNN